MRSSGSVLVVLAIGFVVMASMSVREERRALSAAEKEKQARILSVADDLTSRRTDGLSAAQLEARAANLERLRAYGERGVFTRNDECPDRDIPYFVDSAGTRCALAHLIEAADRGDLLASLVADANNAWISEIDGDPGLGEWLTQNGLTVEEVAYIQAPGYIDPTAPANPSPTNPGSPTPGNPTPAPTTARPTPTTLGPAGGLRGVTPPSRARRTTSASASWETWWLMNADALANPRGAYHDAAGGVTVRTDLPPGTVPTRPQRPTTDEIEALIVPVLDRIATGDDLQLAATGIMALVRASSPATNGLALKRVLAHLGKPSAPYRNFAVLALGIVPDPAAVAHLRGLLLDRPEGRALLSEPSRVPDDMRALAAMALGRCGDEQSVDDMIAILGNDAGASVDLQVACVTALGLLSSDVLAMKKINPFLLSHLEDPKWQTIVVAQIPIALARSQDRTALPPIVAIVDKFKAAPGVRQSAALAIGLLGDGLDRPLVEPLMALAQRDPDATARQFAIMSLAELAGRDSLPATPVSKEREDLLRKLSVFFTDGVGASPRQKTDRPWHAIAGALFARKFEAFKPAVSKSLAELAASSGALDDRAAAAVGLGLLPGEAATQALRALLTSTTAPKVTGYAAESLGMHGDVTVKERLIELCKTHPDDAVRYRAVLGLARLRQPDLMPLFLAVLGESRSQAVQAALTRAIGTIGDKGAIAGLIALAENAEHDRATRERALGALGLIGQRADIAWSMDFKRGCNYAADSPVLRTVYAAF